jgi:predicted alpha/beta hydrolase family esterase
MSSNRFEYIIVPGWQGSSADHWQTHWQVTLPNARRVQQADWNLPEVSAWVDALDESVRTATGRTILIAHSLGCIVVAHWAERAFGARGVRHSACAHREHVQGALLVAPADVDRHSLPHALRRFGPIPARPLPFPALVVGSDSDPTATAERAMTMAASWVAEGVVLERAGHINVKSGHTQWPEGLELLSRLQQMIEVRARRYA